MPLHTPFTLGMGPGRNEVLVLGVDILYNEEKHNMQKVSEYDQEIPLSHTADQPTAPRGREHL